jgi:hypothetical protein
VRNTALTVSEQLSLVYVVVVIEMLVPR